MNQKDTLHADETAKRILSEAITFLAANEYAAITLDNLWSRLGSVLEQITDECRRSPRRRNTLYSVEWVNYITDRIETAMNQHSAAYLRAANNRRAALAAYERGE